VAGALLEHLGVVVGGQQRLALAEVRHREPADEVGQPCEREPFELGVLVQEVVHVPGLVADHEVVGLLLHDVVEDHEVVDEDLVHVADRLEDVQVVLTGLSLDVGRLAREPRRCGVHPFSRLLEDAGDRMLGEPVDLYVGVQRPKVLGDRQVPPGVPETDRRGEVEHPPRPDRRPGPRRAHGPVSRPTGRAAIATGLRPWPGRPRPGRGRRRWSARGPRCPSRRSAPPGRRTR
jgi:hypothetical protein